MYFLCNKQQGNQNQADNSDVINQQPRAAGDVRLDEKNDHDHDNNGDVVTEQPRSKSSKSEAIPMGPPPSSTNQSAAIPLGPPSSS